MTFGVASEVGRLRQVILHRPDLELKRLTPENKRDFLFDEILWVRRAREEHDRFADVLRSCGVEILYFRSLLEETLALPAAKAHVLDATFDERKYGPLAIEALRGLFESMDPATLATYLIGGMTKREVLQRRDEPRSIAFHALDIDAFVLEPLPNSMFTRDTSTWIYGGVSINSMRKKARMRETVHYEAVYRWHPCFAGEDFATWADGSAGGVATTEGGDILVLGSGAVLVGMSERTTPAGIERLASRLFAGGAARCIVALKMPQARAFMHLDTVMTMVDSGRFTKYAGMGMLPSYTITPGVDEHELHVQDHPPEHMHRAIAEALGLADIEVLTPLADVYAALREQWDDGCNVLAVRPGVVVAYERNAATNAYLVSRGIEVVPVAGGELGRGRGGPRCLSCPTRRDPV